MRKDIEFTETYIHTRIEMYINKQNKSKKIDRKKI